MTTMVANASRVAAVAEDATRLLGLRSPGERAADVTATKRRQAQLAPGSVGKPVRSQVLSNAVDPGPGVGAGSPLAALLDQPGFVAPTLLGGPGPIGDGIDVAFADLPPPVFTPAGIVVLGGGGSAGGGSGGGSGGGGTTSTGGAVSTSTGGSSTTGGTVSTTSGGASTTSTGGTTTTSGGSTSTGGTGSTSTGGGSPTSGGTTTSTGGTTTSGGGTVNPNVPAVPEPSTWLMLLAGFAAIGTALRRAVRHAALRGA